MGPLPIFHWAFFRLRIREGTLRLERRKDIRNLAIASSVLLYCGFFLITLAGTDGLERIITCGVCIVAPLLVVLVTSSFGASARQSLDEHLRAVNGRLQSLSLAADGAALRVMQFRMLYGRAEEAETTTMLLAEGETPPAVLAPSEVVPMSRGLDRQLILLVFAGGQRPFGPLLAAARSGACPVTVSEYPAILRLDVPFVLL